ncbi:MAG TPA: hypothetical protein VGL61_07450 [Kofleriaceae bacterium]
MRIATTIYQTATSTGSRTRRGRRSDNRTGHGTQPCETTRARSGLRREIGPAMRKRSPHPLEHHPSFRAVVAATPIFADVARASADGELVGRLAIAACDLASGFAAPPGSTTRAGAHRRAWTAVRELERSLLAIRINRKAPMKMLARAQRAIDRADVMISALPGVVPS